jgi:hypothetical protein
MEGRALSRPANYWDDTAVVPPLYDWPLVILCDFGPIHHVPPSFEIIRPAILVIEIVGVFPNIDAENRFVAVHERAVLVRRRHDFELAAFVFDKPRPTAAETTYARGGELLFKGIETTEGGFDVVGKFSRWLAARLWPHDLPEERMIGVTAAVIAHRRANIFRHRIQVADQILDRFVRQIGFVFKRVVYVRDISLVMFRVMNFHRTRVDVRLECVVCVG